MRPWRRRRPQALRCHGEAAAAPLGRTARAGATWLQPLSPRPAKGVWGRLSLFSFCLPFCALKAAVHFTVGRTCEEVGAELGLSFTKQVIATLSEVTCRQLQTYTADLEAFAKHARRTTINCDDVKLLVRRNSHLADHMKEMADGLEEAGGKKERKKRGRKPKASVAAETSKEEQEPE
ncbi:centromere protein S-like isoform X1 [Penaeus indicus]|uniref:centromere protein S-like isoform X1 n=1 Tax=Penaeus indicus TaxID=29960 RepID=UPI00300D15E5